MRFLNRFSTLVFTSAMVGCFATPASAISINVANHSFEGPVTGTYAVIDPTGWTRYDGTVASGVFRPSSYSASGAGFIAGVHGDQTAYSSSGNFSQTLSEVLGVGTYNLTVAAGFRDDYYTPTTDYTINLLAGGSTIATASNASNLHDGWSDIFATVTITSGNVLIGSPLGIQLVHSANNTQMNWDNVRLSLSVVPVPAALPLFGTGLAALGFLSWRRKRKKA
ncbi:MAG: VPLPA-CTERM sorting domain-containing protein [Rhizobiaceae bacterium]